MRAYRRSSRSVRPPVGHDAGNLALGRQHLGGTGSQTFWPSSRESSVAPAGGIGQFPGGPAEDPMPSELLEAQLLQLPLDERAHLARLLIESLDEQPALDPEWLAEASRRATELREGRIAAVPAQEAFDAARRNLAG